jgi:hypothetical protein
MSQVISTGSINPSLFASPFTLRETFDGTMERFYMNGQQLAAFAPSDATAYTTISGVHIEVGDPESSDSLTFHLSNFAYTPLP